MKSRVLTGAWVFILIAGGNTATYASLIGDTFTGCVANPGTGCTIGDSFSWFSNDTAVVTDPGVEFSGGGGGSGTDWTLSADLTAETVVLTVIWNYYDPLGNNDNATFVSQEWIFKDLDLLANNRTITGLTREAGGTLPTTVPLEFGADYIDITSENLVISAPGTYTYSTTFNIATVPIPPVLYLFGSGLIGLVGVARRKAA